LSICLNTYHLAPLRGGCRNIASAATTGTLICSPSQESDIEFSDIIARVTEAGSLSYRYISQPATLYQIAIIAITFLAALLLSRRVEPRLEARARNIRGDPSLLRMVIALLRRLEWAFFIAFTGVEVLLMRSLKWPESHALTSDALLLGLAWLVIAVLSRTIRSRAFGSAIGWVGWTYVALIVLGISDDAAALLNDIGFTIGNFRLSLLLMVKVVVLLGMWLWLAVTVGNFLDNRIQRSDELTPSLRVLVGKVLRITLIVLAALIAIAGIGVDLTIFTVLSGAIGVGIGFGLQKVVSNFLSGIIILLDRSIKPGDTITLGETFGWIRELRARFVSVVTRDGREYLIPNEDFITREVINWSFSDDFVRLDVPFRVSYDSDPHKVTALAIAAAASVPRVVADRKPVCWLTGFGDSSLDFLLRFWISDPRNGLTNIRGMVLLSLWDTFKLHGIAIPFPQHEVNVKAPLTLSGNIVVQPAAPSDHRDRT
jgi:small-conductance mechanosensitive channel